MRRRLIIEAAGLLLVAAAAQAQTGGRLAAQFDRPTAMTKLPAKSADDPNGQIDCIYYKDLMIRESGTDSPDPNAAILVPLPDGQARPRCDAAHRPDEVTLKTEGFSFVGRKGPFLLFTATDPNGAVPFTVIDAGSGRVIFEDATAADRGIQSVAAANGTLHLRYKRGLNAPCSLMQNATACWSQLIAEGKIPTAMEQPAPTASLCTASYKAQKAPADDPSIVAYDVELTVDAAGHTEILSHGAVGCSPLP